MKWISIISAAAVLVVSVFIVGLATANDHIDRVPDSNTSKSDVIAACASFVGADSGLKTASPAAAAALRPSKYKMLVGVIEDNKTKEWKVQVICPKGFTCQPKSEGHIVQDLNAKLKVDVRFYSEASCYVCTGGFCFKVC